MKKWYKIESAEYGDFNGYLNIEGIITVSIQRDIIWVRTGNTDDSFERFKKDVPGAAEFLAALELASTEPIKEGGI